MLDTPHKDVMRMYRVQTAKQNEVLQQQGHTVFVNTKTSGKHKTMRRSEKLNS